MYSSHNLRALGGRLPDVELPEWVPTLNPARLAVRAVRYWRARWRRQRNRKWLRGQQFFGDGYAVVNDEAYDHGQLTVYVDPGHEVAQLAKAGFAEIAIIDAQGRRDQALRRSLGVLRRLQAGGRDRVRQAIIRAIGHPGTMLQAIATAALVVFAAVVLAVAGVLAHVWMQSLRQPPAFALIVEKYYACPERKALHGGIFGKGPTRILFPEGERQWCWRSEWQEIDRAEFKRLATLWHGVDWSRECEWWNAD